MISTIDGLSSEDIAQPALVSQTACFSSYQKQTPFLSGLLERAVEENDENYQLTVVLLRTGAAFCSGSRRCGS